MERIGGDMGFLKRGVVFFRRGGFPQGSVREERRGEREGVQSAAIQVCPGTKGGTRLQRLPLRRTQNPDPEDGKEKNRRGSGD